MGMSVHGEKIQRIVQQLTSIVVEKLFSDLRLLWKFCPMTLKINSLPSCKTAQCGAQKQETTGPRDTLLTGSLHVINEWHRCY